MKKAILKELQTNPTDYIVVGGECFSLYLSADLEQILKDYPVDEKETYTFQLLDTGEVKTAFVYGVGKINKAHRNRFPDTAVFLNGAPATPGHGEKVPHFVKKSDPRKRCKGDHALDMDVFYRTWKDRVRASIKKFGFKESSLIDDLEQDVYMRMIKFRIIEDCICALPMGASFSTHVFGVIRTVCLNYSRDNGKVKECLKCATHEKCLTPGRCKKCKACVGSKKNPKCKVCISCRHCTKCAGPRPSKAPACTFCHNARNPSGYKYMLCKQCQQVKVCVDCKVCRYCRDEKERPVRNVLSQAEPLVLTGHDGEEFLHPEVSKLCDGGDTIASPLEKFLTMLQAELDGQKPWTDQKGTIKSLTLVSNMFYMGYTAKEIAVSLKSSPVAVSVWRARIRWAAERLCWIHRIPLESLFECPSSSWSSLRSEDRMHNMENRE